MPFTGIEADAGHGCDHPAAQRRTRCKTAEVHEGEISQSPIAFWKHIWLLQYLSNDPRRSCSRRLTVMPKNAKNSRQNCYPSFGMNVTVIGHILRESKSSPVESE